MADVQEHVAMKVERPGRVLLAATFGNALETFDGLMYGFLAVIVAKVFFPRASEAAALLLTLATFGIGFVVRPVGAVLLGVYADRRGRRDALTLSIGFMVVGTGLIAFAPSYEVAGMLSPVIVVLARLLQGLGHSGEYGSAVALLTEAAPPHKRAFYASFQMCSTWVGITFAGAVGYFGATHLNSAQLTEWGWRVPFMIGLLLGPVGYYVRKHVEEPLDCAMALQQSVGERVRELFLTNLPQLLAAMGICSIGLSTYYLMFNYLPTYAVRELGLPIDAPFLCTIIAGLIIMVFAPIFGKIVDIKSSARTIYAISILIVAGAALPLFRWVIAAPSLARLLVVILAMGIPLAAMNTLIVIVSSQIFPQRRRAAGLGTSWNVSSVIFGGFAPFLASYTIGATGDKAAPAYYVIGTAVIALLSLLALRWMGDSNEAAGAPEKAAVVALSADHLTV